MAGRSDSQCEHEDDDLAAARWVTAIERGLEPSQTEAFHAWLAARPDRAERIARSLNLAIEDAARDPAGVPDLGRLNGTRQKGASDDGR